jgi:hypothetical protein
MTTDAYRKAYEAALGELTNIHEKFEQLRTRKGQVENLINALHSVFSPDESRSEAMPIAPEMAQVEIEAPVPQKDPVPQPESDAPSSYSYLEVPNPLPESDGDPFQRRVKAAFKFRGLATQRSY